MSRATAPAAPAPDAASPDLGLYAEALESLLASTWERADRLTLRVIELEAEVGAWERRYRELHATLKSR